VSKSIASFGRAIELVRDRSQYIVSKLTGFSLHRTRFVRQPPTGR
jgi:hypothetical protein